MHLMLSDGSQAQFAIDAVAWLNNIWQFIKVLIGFSIIIFVHELGHFLAAKWVGIRVERFAVGFTYRLFGWRRGEGFTFGPRPQYTAEEIRDRAWGETDYCFNALPFGGYVKMMGHDDIIIDEKTGAIRFSDDPRAFTNRPVSQRMVVVSAGVIFNLLFALLLFMIIYLVGKDMLAPIIGSVDPSSAAGRAGVLAGDRVVRIDGDQIQSFNDIVMHQVLADSPQAFEIERAGRKLERPIIVEPEPGMTRGLASSGMIPKVSTVVAADSPPDAFDSVDVKKGDRIVAVNGTPVEDKAAIDLIYLQSGGKPVRLQVRRANGETVEIEDRALLFVDTAELEPKGSAEVVDHRHLLGFRQRRIALDIEKRDAAEQAGVKPGDVMAEWGTIVAPTFPEIKSSIERNAGLPIRLVVERDGQRIPLTLTPKREFSWFGKGTAKAGINFGHILETERTVLSQIVPGTPAAALNAPREAEILEIDGKPTPDWFAVVYALMEAAGRKIAVRFRAGDVEATGRMDVPSSVYSELNLPLGARVLSINGESSLPREGEGEWRLPNYFALREMLRRHIGHEVTIGYIEHPLAPVVKEGKFAVRPDNVDPWQMRILLLFRGAAFEPVKEAVSANGNPLKAMWMGIDETYTSMASVYLVLKQMLKRKVSVENVSGPVGIFGHAMEQARVGIIDLLHFLAFLSVNLAVLNFLPFPLVDGGLMIFLIIEKIRGKALSIKTQMGITFVGLALILLCFLFVTFQDVSRLFG